MTDIEVPFSSSTKNFHKYILKNDKYIISIYLPIKDFAKTPETVKVTA